MRACGGRSALGVLRRLAGLLQAVLLRLLLACVAGEEAGLLERRALLGVELGKGAGDAEAEGTGLARHAATVDGGVDVVHLVGVGDLEGLGHDHAVHGRREVVLEAAAVDRDGAGAGTDPDPRDGPLAAAGGLVERLGQRRTPVTACGGYDARLATVARSRMTGCWAS